MTRVMRDELLAVTANLLERDGLPRLARAVRSAVSELSLAEPVATATSVLESIAGGVLDDALVRRLVALAEAPLERALADDVAAGGPTKVAAVTRLAEAMAQREAQATATSTPAETS
jgi:hypothetical protein